MNNRYEKIHVLFRMIAIEKFMKKFRKGEPAVEINQGSMQVKAFWKNLFGVSSLTELDDENLQNLTKVVERRLQILSKSREKKEKEKMKKEKNLC